MRITLDFELPEDVEAFETYRQAPQARNALVEFRAWLRVARKYRELSPDAEEIWTEFHSILASEGVDIT